MTDLLSLRYLPISKAELFDNNAKLHNIDQIISSIARYGFKSAAKWESTLNDGRGGIVAGNGRVEALRVMEGRGDDLPVGIAQDTDTGEWCVPVLFGVEADSEAIARAYALDDNNLTLLGGDFALADLAKLYDQELLMSELKELAESGELPVTFDNDFTVETLQPLAEGNSNNNVTQNYRDVNDDDISKSDGKLKSQFDTKEESQDILITCPHCGSDFVYK